MSTKPKVDLETTISSYFTARRSRDLVMAANLEITREWWSRRKNDFEFFVSQVVIKESGAGDPDAAKRRLEFLRPFPRLDISVEVESLAAKLIFDVPLPPKAQADALHIAVAAVHEMNYLVTWNCTHTLRMQLSDPKLKRFAGLKDTSHPSSVRHKKCWRKKTKMRDTIIQEIRNTRDEYARQFNYDLHQMSLDLRREQERSGAQVVTFSTKSAQTDLAEQSGQREASTPALP